MTDRPILIPLSALVAFFVGLSFFCFALSAFDNSQRYTAQSAMLYYTTGFGGIFALGGVGPITCAPTRTRVTCAIWLVSLSSILYIWATIAGISVFYSVSQLTTDDLTIFYIAWLTPLLAALADISFLVFAIKIQLGACRRHRALATN